MILVYIYIYIYILYTVMNIQYIYCQILIHMLTSKHMYKYRYRRTLTSDFSSSKWWETQFLSLLYRTILTPSFNARNPTLCPNGRNSNIVFHRPTSKSQLPGRTSTFQHHGRTPTEYFSNSSKFSAHLFWAWRYPHSSPIFSLGFIMTMVIDISFAHERKLLQSTTHVNS